MHKSRLAGFIIDCQTNDLEDAARFWGAALGLESSVAGVEYPALYRRLNAPADQPHIEVQKVAHESRVHLDIETDDVDAEVKRLERLGATRVEPLRTWYVMQAPTGQRFCVVRPQRPDFSVRANVWED